MYCILPSLCKYLLTPTASLFLNLKRSMELHLIMTKRIKVVGGHLYRLQNTAQYLWVRGHWRNLFTGELMHSWGLASFWSLLLLRVDNAPHKRKHTSHTSTGKSWQNHCHGRDASRIFRHYCTNLGEECGVQSLDCPYFLPHPFVSWKFACEITFWDF